MPSTTEEADAMQPWQPTCKNNTFLPGYWSYCHKPKILKVRIWGENEEKLLHTIQCTNSVLFNSKLFPLLWGFLPSCNNVAPAKLILIYLSACKIIQKMCYTKDAKNIWKFKWKHSIMHMNKFTFYLYRSVNNLIKAKFMFYPGRNWFSTVTTARGTISPNTLGHHWNSIKVLCF